jgi:hypothetical protein
MTNPVEKSNLTAETTLQIRKHPGRQWFWIDNYLCDTFGAQIGPVALAVYTVLARYADNTTATCYPSVGYLATYLGTETEVITPALERLMAVGLIVVTHRHRQCPLITLLDPRTATPVVVSPAVLPSCSPSCVEIEKTELVEDAYKEDNEKNLVSPEEKETKETESLLTLGREERETKTQFRASAPDDGTSSWAKEPVHHPDPERPDEYLAALGLLPGEEDYERLLAAAEAELAADGQNPFYIILPIKQARMIQILMRDGVIPTAAAAMA